MSLPPFKRFIKRKNNQDFLQSLKFFTPEDHQKELLYFPEDQQQCRSELEMPIKIQGDLRYQKSINRQNQLPYQSNQSSDHLEQQQADEQNDEKIDSVARDKETAKYEYDILMNPQNKIDPLDALLMPLYDPRPLMNMNEHNQFYMYDELQGKEESHWKPEVGGMVKQQGSFGDCIRLQDKKKSILTIINSFKAYYQATLISVNYHKLSKKDSLNKVCSNILSVITKQNRRMFEQLQSQRHSIEAALQIATYNFSKVSKNANPLLGQNQQLLKTGCQGQHLEVKCEEDDSPESKQ